MRATLTNLAGAELVVNRGSSAVLVGTFTDLDSVTLDKGAIQSLVVSVYDPNAGRYLSGRKDQTILDANGGAVAADGTLTLRLSPDDLDVCALSINEESFLFLTFKWQWTDDAGQQTGVAQFELHIIGSP